MAAFSMPQEYIDQFLRYGSNTENHRTRIAIEYAKQQPMDDLVDFLEKTYHGGYGLQFGTTKVCAWYAEDGIHLAYGSAARYTPNAQILSWENVAVRIGELLEQGQFATNVELAECGTFEKRQLAEQLWYMSHDISEKAIEAGHMSIVRSLRGGFPEETEKLMVFLSEPESYQAIMRQVYAFRDACNADKGMMRFQMYHPNKLIRPLEEYTLPRREYVSEMAELPVGNIVYAESRQHQVCIHLKDGESHVCYGSLSSLEVPLCPLGFLRVHRSFLVNMLYILKLQSQEVVLKDGTALKVSERNYSELKTQYQTWKRRQGPSISPESL